MFDVSWSELLILAAVTLIFVGPKELPVFLGTLGRYAGQVRRQAADFRRHFDDAMREAELDQMRTEVETMARDVNDSVMSATRAAEKEVIDAKAALTAPVPPQALSTPQPLASVSAIDAPLSEAAALSPPPARTISEHG